MSNNCLSFKDDSRRTITVNHKNKGRTNQVHHSGIKSPNFFTSTGWLIQNSVRLRFKRIRDGISAAHIHFDNNHHLNIIVAYAPTLIENQLEPPVCKGFYNELEHQTSKHKKNKCNVMVLDHFRAKTRSGNSRTPKKIGKCSKRYLSKNGDNLLEYAK